MPRSSKEVSRSQKYKKNSKNIDRHMQRALQSVPRVDPFYDEGSLSESNSCLSAASMVSQDLDSRLSSGDSSPSMSIVPPVSDLVDIPSSNDFPDSDPDDSEESNVQMPEKSFKDFLRNWAVDKRIRANALSKLLKGIRSHEIDKADLPLDARTLLKTPRSGIQSVTPVPLAGGDYIHFGLKQGLLDSLKGGLKDSYGPLQSNGVNRINVKLSFDGLPLNRSTDKNFWPQLGSLLEAKDETPFCIGIYYGTSKPSCFREYTSETITEARSLHENPFEFEGHTYQLCFEGPVICDIPAKSDIKNIKHHSGYNSCDKCTQRGIFYLRRLTFPYEKLVLRTDTSFRKKTDGEHHNGDSGFLPLPIDMVKSFVTDYMHLVCLGVMRRLLMLWLRVKNKNKLGTENRARLSRLLVGLKKHTPREFARKPRTLKEIRHFKATEFRQFLLYSGPVILKNVLPRKVYNHFMLFSVAIRILVSSDAFDAEYVDYADTLLHKFVKEFASFYGKHNLVRNVHGLLHLCEDVRNFGPLDFFAAYIFESFLGIHIKPAVRCPLHPLVQVAKRYYEIKENRLHNPPIDHQLETCQGEHKNGPTVHDVACLQYKTYNHNKFVLKICSPDNCVMLNDGQVVLIENVIKDDSGIRLVGRTFKYFEDMFQSPCLSKYVNICVANSPGSLQEYEVADVVFKCVYYPQKNDKYVILPMVHSQCQ